MAHYSQIVRYSLILILFGSVTLLHATNETSNFPEIHQWSDKDRAILKSLWIEQLPDNTDASNQHEQNQAAIKLGHHLFFDKRLSRNNQVSCATCHQPGKFFTDGRAVAKGLAEVKRNTPTIVGASQHTWFFLDGRSDSLWSQALGPIENEQEHGSNRGHVAQLIYHDLKLRKLYEIAFDKLPDLANHKRFPKNSGPVTDKTANKNWQSMKKQDQELLTTVFVNTGKAIAAYEAQLQHAPSRFDQYIKAMLAGNLNNMQLHLSQKELKGMRIFIKKARCITCHSGPMLSDKEFHNISVQPVEGEEHDIGRFAGARELLNNPFNCRGRYNDAHRKSQQADCSELEYMVMDRHETQGAFKTPSLRNVAKTAPYMHAGQYKTLIEVFKHYNDPPPVKFRQSELFLQVDLEQHEFLELEAFLKSLNSPIQADKKYLNSPLTNSVK